MKKVAKFIGEGEAICVEYGISSTNRSYFAITATIGNKERSNDRFTCIIDGKKLSFNYVSGGCQHEEIEKHFPNQFTDLIALHLSDINGVPMYAVENGWYHWCNNRQVGKKYLRLTDEEYKNLCEIIDSAPSGYVTQTGKGKFIDFVETLVPRWKTEADAAIEKYGLRLTEEA